MAQNGKSGNAATDAAIAAAIGVVPGAAADAVPATASATPGDAASVATIDAASVAAIDTAGNTAAATATDAAGARATSAGTPTPDLLIIGAISGVFGCDGWVRVRSHTEAMLDIARYPRWLVGARQWTQYEVAEVRAHGNGLVAKLAGVEDRTQALALMHLDIAITKEQLPPLAPGEYYWFQLTGLQVVNLRGEVLGAVSRLIATGANDVLEVSAAGATCLIPYIRDVVKRVDTRGGTIEVDWRKEWCDAN